MKKPSKLLALLLMTMAITACGTPSESISDSASTEPSITDSSGDPSTSTEPSSEDPSISSEDPSTSVEEPSISTPDPEPEQIARGDAALAVANPGIAHISVAETVTMQKSFIEDGAYTLRYNAAIATLEDLIFYLQNAEAEVGKRYMVSFDLNSSQLFSATINGQVHVLDRGPNPIEFSFDQTVAPSLIIKFAAGEELIKANEVVLSNITFREVTYDAVEDIVVDGNIADWTGVRAFENTVGVYGQTEDTSHKSVTFYAALTDAGLYVAAVAYHDVYTTDKTTWYNNTNLEFFIKGGNQYWVTAGSQNQAKVTQKAITNEVLTEEGGANYRTVIEAFVARENLPANAVVAGQVRVGFAWKTNDDLNTGGEAAGGGYDAYWVPKGTWVNNADQTYVTYNGIFRSNQVDIDPTLKTIDGDLSDWVETPAYIDNFVYFAGTEETSHKNVKFMAQWLSDGLYVAAIANHDVLISDQATWHMNTNFEFFLNGGTQYYIAANGDLAVGRGIIVSEETPEADTAYQSIAEVFIPKAFINNEDMQRVGFAWKTTGDMMTGAGGSAGAPDAWWYAPGHNPGNLAEQYYVTANGIFVNDPTVVE